MSLSLSALAIGNRFPGSGNFFLVAAVGTVGIPLSLGTPAEGLVGSADC
jgi:hypothetical protein